MKNTPVITNVQVNGLPKLEPIAVSTFRDFAANQPVFDASIPKPNMSPSKQSLGCNGQLLDLNIVLGRANVGIMHRDLDQQVLIVNEHYSKLVGRSAEELEGLPVADFTHPDDLARSLAMYAAHLRRATPFEIEQRYIRPDGSAIWCAVHVSFVTDEIGRAISTITLAKDISARRRVLDALRESEEHYRHAVELNPQITWTANADGQIAEASSRWCDVTGIAPHNALGHGWLAALHAEDIPRTLKSWQASLESLEPVDIQYRLRTVNGTYRWFRSRAAPRLNEAGEVMRWYGTLEDIHDRVVTEQALRESEERFRLATHAAGLGIIDYDVLGERCDWSRELRKLFGFPAGVGPSVALVLDCVIPEDRHLVEPLFADTHAGKPDPSGRLTFRIRRIDNSAETWLSASRWRVPAESGAPTRILVTMRDVTEERTADERIRWIALHDALTQLPNRTHFNQILADALARAALDEARLALLLLDIDRLKEANDLIGHDAGDTLLQVFAMRVLEIVGAKGHVARLGGDEFAVLLVDTDEAIVRDVTARLMPELRKPFTVQGYTLDCQATAGASLYPQHGMAAEDLLKAADMALYAGKARNRGNVSVFRAEMRAGMQQRSSMLRVARSIIHDDLVVPYYQPKVSLADGHIVGFEALLRWNHSRLGLQGPDTIAGAFDDIDLATELSERMLERVVGDIRQWMDRGLEFGRIAFNVSPAEFRSENVADRILRRLRDANIPSSRFELEVTETVFLGSGAGMVGTLLEAFHAAGVTIALDDFGTGYASLTHLKVFPVDVIKIDRSFVSNLTTAPGDAAIVNAVIGLGRDLDVEVVAEGVETKDQAAHLRQQGCRFAQGYLFGEAVTFEAASALLR